MTIETKTKEDVLAANQAILEGAITALEGGDVGAHWEREVIEAARSVMASDRSRFQRIRGRLKAAGPRAQITEWDKEVKGAVEGMDDTTKADEIVELAQASAVLFHDPEGECFASFEQRGITENWGINSKGFREWIGFRAYTELGFVPSDMALNSAISTLRGIATHEGEEHKTYLRCAPWQGGYLIDLTNSSWQAIEVLPTGWRLIDNPSIKFIRSHTASPLPVPIIGGNLEKLWDYANIPVDLQSMVITFVLDAWRPDTPYPLLFLTGGQGRGKSTTHRAIRQLCDPNTVPLRAAPSNVEDVFVSAGANHMASYENMSNLRRGMQDALCTLATGGGYAKRQLYTDSDETVIEVKRPAIINGIPDVVTQPDLIDRTIHAELPKLAEYRDEGVFAQEYERDLPEIFGGLLDLFVKALSILPSIRLVKSPRMVGFCRLGEAVHLAHTKRAGFSALYLKNRSDSLARSLDSSPAAQALVEMMTSPLQPAETPWEGTIQALKAALDLRHAKESEGWPRSARGLAEVLRKMEAPLLEAGVHVEFLGRERDGYRIRISFTDPVKESKNNVHEVHKFTDDSDCEHVNVVNIKNEKKNRSNGEGIPETPAAEPDTALSGASLLAAAEKKGVTLSLKTGSLTLMLRSGSGQATTEQREWFNQHSEALTAALKARESRQPNS